MAKVEKARRRIGRPPAGAREGEKVKDYPQLSMRVPSDVKARLQALSAVKSLPQWRIITDAIDCYLRERPDEERKRIGELVRRVPARRRSRPAGKQ
jgi:predicted DNA-binding protein